MVIDDLAIGRILTAVGESFEPAGLDRSELRAAIEDALTGAKIIEKFRAGPRVKTCSKQLGRIHKAAVSERLARWRRAALHLRGIFLPKGENLAK